MGPRQGSRRMRSVGEMGSLGCRLAAVEVGDGWVNGTRRWVGCGFVQFHGGGSYGDNHRRRILVRWGQ